MYNTKRSTIKIWSKTTKLVISLRIRCTWHIQFKQNCIVQKREICHHLICCSHNVNDNAQDLHDTWYMLLGFGWWLKDSTTMAAATSDIKGK